MHKAIRSLLSLGLVAMVPAMAQAQISIGIKGGLAFATLSESDLSPDFKTQVGWLAGAHLTLGRGVFAFQPEALIAQLGTELQPAGKVKIRYLMVPANLRLNLLTGGVQPFILGGPYAAFKLSCDVEDFPVPLDCEDDLQLKDTDWGLDVGGGLKFGGRMGFFVEARYALGLKDIGAITEGFDSKNRVFMVMAGLAF